MSNREVVSRAATAPERPGGFGSVSPQPENVRRLYERGALGTEARPFPYEWIFLYDTEARPHPTVAEIARDRGVDPVEAVLDLALEKDLERFFIHPSPTSFRTPTAGASRGEGREQAPPSDLPISHRRLRARSATTATSLGRSTGFGT